MSEVKYPDMRQELVQHLEALSDADYQRRVWVGRLPDGKIKYDELDYAIHFLYDDTTLADNPGAAIGFILQNEEEAKFINILIVAIDLVFSKYGIDLTDSEYIETPEWKKVIESARQALSFIR